jgi:hypothetical protein
MMNVSREDARRFWFEVRRKQREAAVLEPIESLASDIVSKHPEYHSLLDNPDEFREQDWSVEGGQPNPFLHLGMHLAIREQVSIDQPTGIRDLYVNYARKIDNALEADHLFAECLAEQIWQVQHNRVPFSSEQYLSDIRRALKV